MDIVERLRQWTRCKSEYPTRSLDDDMEEASTAIERLRARLEIAVGLFNEEQSVAFTLALYRSSPSGDMDR